jgi:integrase
LHVAESRHEDTGLTRNVVRLTDAIEQPATKIDPLTIEEAQAVLAAAKDDRLEALAVLAIGVGMRQGECLRLRWSDIDLKAGTLRVVKAKSRAGVRTVPLPGFVVDALKAHRARQREEVMAAKIWGDRDLVFTTTIGTLIERRNLLRWWHALTEGAGVGRRRFHVTRHTAATIMLNKGEDLAVISQVLGHSRLTVTHAFYARADAERLRGAANTMQGVFGDDDAEAVAD